MNNKLPSKKESSFFILGLIFISLGVFINLHDFNLYIPKKKEILPQKKNIKDIYTTKLYRILYNYAELRWYIEDETKSESVKLPSIIPTKFTPTSGLLKFNEAQQILHDYLQKNVKLTKEDIYELDKIVLSGKKFFNTSYFIQTTTQKIPHEEESFSKNISKLLKILNVDKKKFLVEISCIKHEIETALKKYKKSQKKRVSVKFQCNLNNKTDLSIWLKRSNKRGNFRKPDIYQLWLQIYCGVKNLDGIFGEESEREFIRQFGTYNKELLKELLKEWNNK